MNKSEISNYVLLLVAVLACAGCRQADAPFSAKARAEQIARAKVQPTVVAVSREEDKPAEKSAPADETVANAAEAAASDEVALVDDAATQLLRERLSPPKQVVVTPPAAATEPRPRAMGPVEMLKLPVVKLPEADISKTPSVLPHERQKTPFNHSALDAPPLAFARDPARPEIPKLPRGAGAFVAAPDLKLVPPLARFPRDAERAAVLSDDPTANATQQIVTAPLALPPPVLPPPLLLSIPDPYEHARAVELQPVPADADPPAVSHARPARPVLTPPAPKP